MDYEERSCGVKKIGFNTMFKKDPCLVMNTSPHSPHSIILDLISPNTTLLDIGCNTGFIGKALKKKNIISDGIDVNKDALKIAKKYYRSTYLQDLSSGILNIPKNKYDYILFIDLLEHLPLPDLLLKSAKKNLKDKGTIIVSLPNIARLEIRMNLLFGKFNYTDSGILSEDHLRFFTRDSAVKMIKECGYKVLKIIPSGLGHMMRLFETLTAFQFIFVCKSK